MQVWKTSSKVFDCINHNLLIAKLNAYGVEESSLDFIHFYLTKRKQRIKKVSSLLWDTLRSFLGPILFKIYICDMFLEAPSNIAFAG